ncbi:MAG: hypothetical protein ACRC0S_06660 [Fusobacteriaceae bacterium]
MNYDKFGELLSETNNIIIYLSVLLIVTMFLYKKIRCLFDPLWITIISQAAMISVVLILMKANAIEKKNAINLLIIAITFLCSLKIFIKKNTCYKNLIIEKKKDFKIFYLIHTFIFLMIAIIYFEKVGLAGFKDKVNIFKNFGLIRYIIGVIIPGQIIIVFIKRNLYLQREKKDLLIVMLAICFSIFQGGKANIVFCFMQISMTKYMIYGITEPEKFKKYKTLEKYLLLISAIVIVVAFKYTMETKEFTKTLNAIMFRLISEADIIYLYYPNKLFDLTKGFGVIEYYLNSLVRPLYSRIFGDLNNTTIGFEIIEKIYNIKNPIFGPNTRAEVIWEQNFGYMGFLFSICSAYVFGKFRSMRPLNYISIYLCVLGIMNIDLILREFSLFTVNYLLGILFGILPIICITKFLFCIVRKDKKIKRED